ncbi:AGK_G0000970.mRNA.1.CDS.1 [Saccharomyces cerevisiae]|nr:AGK_G0000970.mRNA.1.CDS.1 [Saccharomyces cerevisiae]CAI6474827.1 AGK_G0000970.mRNA.1.CDS.1 [Saccharomyces cerevisiae]
MNLSPNLPSHYPTSPLVTLSHSTIPLPTTIHLSTYYHHPPPIITVTLQLPISNSTSTYPAITLPSTMSYSLYCCSTHHIETLTNDRK